MNISLTKQQLMVQKAAKRFAQDVCKPIAAEIDKEHRFPVETLALMAKYGLTAVGMPTEYGGAGKDVLAQVLMVEEIAKECVGTSAILSIHQSACTCINTFGSAEIKEKYLRPCIEDGVLAAFALTEPNAGSDASNVQTTAVEEDDCYVINGTKCFITGAGRAGVYVVLALTEPELKTRGISAFILTPDMPGFTIGKIEDKIGIRCSDAGELIFKNVRVPKENLVGPINKGFKIALTGIDRARTLVVGAQALGLAEAALQQSVEYSQGRVQFGKPVSAQQGLQWYLAEMAVKVETMRWLTYSTAQMLEDGHPDFSRNTAMCKLYTSQAAREVAERALQIHGGYGLMSDYPIERLYRDSKVLEIYEGTNEIQKLVISRFVLK